MRHEHVLTYNQGVDAEVVILDDIVQEAYKKSVRDQKLEYHKHPSQFLRRLPPIIGNRVLKCKGRTPVITGEPNKRSVEKTQLC